MEKVNLDVDIQSLCIPGKSVGVAMLMQIGTRRGPRIWKLLQLPFKVSVLHGIDKTTMESLNTPRFK